MDSRDIVILNPRAPISHELACIKGEQAFAYLGGLRAPTHETCAQQQRPEVSVPAWLTQAFEMGHKTRQARQAATLTID
ncbi:MAG: hypothetical protein ABTQ34_07435 [Bdellovibrionales bacterium]